MLRLDAVKEMIEVLIKIAHMVMVRITNPGQHHDLHLAARLATADSILGHLSRAARYW